MKVLELVEQEQITTGQQLRDAFTELQWDNILRWMFRGQLDRMDSGYRRERYMNAYRRDLGKESRAGTPSTWVSRATANGISVPLRSPTWQSIYDYIAPHADQQIRLSPVDPGSEVHSDQDQTPETRQEIASWVQGPADGRFVNNPEIEDPNQQPLAIYLNSWLLKLFEERGDDFRDRMLANNRQNQIMGHWISSVNRINRTMQNSEDNSISKNDVDISLYAFLVNADEIIRAQRQAD